jgi:hypothetical protein
LFTKYKLAATAGPIPKAKINVPIPTVPPRYQPIKITLTISAILLVDFDA